MAKVEMERTTAPEPNPHRDLKGVAISAPYNEDFHPRIKQLPDWAWEWRSEEEVWVVDVIVWEEWVAPLLREVYGNGEDESHQQRSKDEQDTDSGDDASENRGSDGGDSASDAPRQKTFG